MDLSERLGHFGVGGIHSNASGTPSAFFHHSENGDRAFVRTGSGHTLGEIHNSGHIYRAGHSGPIGKVDHSGNIYDRHGKMIADASKLSHHERGKALMALLGHHSQH